jgi:hypothetical protein
MKFKKNPQLKRRNPSDQIGFQVLSQTNGQMVHHMVGYKLNTGWQALLIQAHRYLGGRKAQDVYDTKVNKVKLLS